MSKEITDMLGRLNGDLIALTGMEAKFSTPVQPSNQTFEQAAQPAPPMVKPKKEDYDFLKKLTTEIEGLCKSLDEQIDKELKVPPSPDAEAAAPPPSSPPSAHSATAKK